MRPLRIFLVLAAFVMHSVANGSVTEFTYDSKGNPTQRRDWDSTLQASQPTCSSSPALSTSNAVVRGANFDAYGNVTDSYYGTSPSSTSEDVHTGYDANSLYPQTVTEAYGNALKRSTQYNCDFNTGLLQSATDYNGLSRTYMYDNLERQTQLSESGSGGTLRVTSTSLDDQNRRVSTISDLAAPGDQKLGSVVDYDQLF